MSDRPASFEYRNVPRDDHYVKQKYRPPVVRELGGYNDEKGSRPPKYYKPSILRTPVILALLTVILILIGIVEFACRISPSEAFKRPTVAGTTINVRRRAPLPQPTLSFLTADNAFEDRVQPSTQASTNASPIEAKHGLLARVAGKDIEPSGSYLSQNTQAASTAPHVAPVSSYPPKTTQLAQSIPPQSSTATEDAVAPVAPGSSYLPQTTQPIPTVPNGPPPKVEPSSSFLPKNTQPVQSTPPQSSAAPNPPVSSAAQPAPVTLGLSVATSNYLPAATQSLQPADTAPQPIPLTTPAPDKHHDPGSYIPATTAPLGQPDADKPSGGNVGVQVSTAYLPPTVYLLPSGSSIRNSVPPPSAVPAAAPQPSNTPASAAPPPSVVNSPTIIQPPASITSPAPQPAGSSSEFVPAGKATGALPSDSYIPSDTTHGAGHSVLHPGPSSYLPSTTQPAGQSQPASSVVDTHTVIPGGYLPSQTQSLAPPYTPPSTAPSGGYLPSVTSVINGASSGQSVAPQKSPTGPNGGPSPSGNGGPSPSGNGGSSPSGLSTIVGLAGAGSPSQQSGQPGSTVLPGGQSQQGGQGTDTGKPTGTITGYLPSGVSSIMGAGGVGGQSQQGGQGTDSKKPTGTTIGYLPSGVSSVMGVGDIGSQSQQSGQQGSATLPAGASAGSNKGDASIGIAAVAGGTASAGSQITPPVFAVGYIGPSGKTLVPVGTAAPNLYVDTNGNTVSLSSTPSLYVGSNGKTYTEGMTGSPVSAVGYIGPNGKTLVPVGTAAPNLYVDTNGNTVSLSATPSLYVDSTGKTYTEGMTAAPGATPTGIVVVSAGGRIFGTGKSDGILPTVATGVPGPNVRPGTIFTTTDAQGSVVIATAGITQYVTSFSTDRQGHTHTEIYIQGTLTTSTSTDATGGIHLIVATSEPTQRALMSGPNRVNRPVHNLTSETYFTASYLPIFVAILLRITVGMIYAAVKMLEPFYTLANHSGGGVLAKDFLNINYLATNDNWDPITALFRGHWLMLLTSVLYVVVGLMTPFASEFSSMFYFCNSDNVCGPELRVNPFIGRILEALLGCTAVMLVGFIITERRHDSGVFADPSSIASMATLLHQPQVVEDFQQMDAGASKKDMENILKGKRYCLDFYKHSDGSERYGIVAMHFEPMSVVGGSRDRYDALPNPEAANHALSPTQHQLRQRKKHHYYRIARDSFLGLVTAGMLIIIAWYYTNSNQNNTFEKFIDGQNFGPRFVFSVFGILIHSQWKRIEREVCIIQPFRRLAEGDAPAEASILINRTLNPITTLFKSFPRRHVFCALTAIVSLLAETLILTLSGITFNAGQLFLAFKISAYISMGILAIMLLLLPAVYFRRPKGPALPRTPNTIGAVFSYLCASPLLEDFADLATCDEKSKRRRVNDMGKKYLLDVMEGGDGRARWQISYDYGNSGLDP